MLNKIKKYFTRISKRLYVKCLLWNRKSKTAEQKKISESEKICMSICRGLITNPNSKFLLAPVSGKNMYDAKVEAIRQEYEDEIMSQIENSLTKIQNKVKGLEFLIQERNEKIDDMLETNK